MPDMAHAREAVFGLTAFPRRLAFTLPAWLGFAAVVMVATTVTAQVRPLETPAAPGSGMVSLAASPTGEVFLSWIEPAGPLQRDKDSAPRGDVGGAAAPADGDGGAAAHALRVSRFDGERWTAPATVATGRDWFVNWADHPGLAVVDARTLMAHWLVKSGETAGVYGYGIRLARSVDAGATWQPVGDIGVGARDDYSGFVTWMVERDRVRVAYLAPRAAATPATQAAETASGPAVGAHEAHDEDAAKTLVVATITPGGTTRDTTRTLDDDTCQCCTTSSAMTSNGAVIVYRDHLPGEIRDIAIVREARRGWTEPAPVARDGWVMPGCPTNGPVVAARDARVAVAWFTAANETPRVKVSFSADAGATFEAPIEVGADAPHGWPAIVMLDDGSAVVSWMEGTGADGDVRLRRVWRDGRMTEPRVVAKVRAGRSAGIPQMARHGDALIVAWRTDRVETARVTVPGRPAARRHEQAPPPAPPAATPVTLPGAETFVYRGGTPDPMRLHVFKPAGWAASDRRPALMFFFGGGWSRGTPERSAAWARWAASLGLVGIAPDYRTRERFGTTPLEAAADGRAALRWVQDHAAELGLDRARIVVGGSSAGGHVALWTAIAANPPGSAPHEAPLLKPAALVLMSAVSDTSTLSGYTPYRFGDHARALSPLHQLDARMPPVLAFHGDADPTVPYSQAVALRDALSATGNVTELVTVPGGNHGFSTQFPEWRDKARALIKAFLEAHNLVHQIGVRSGK